MIAFDGGVELVRLAVRGEDREEKQSLRKKVGVEQHERRKEGRRFANVGLKKRRKRSNAAASELARGWASSHGTKVGSEARGSDVIPSARTWAKAGM
jgi:hypothetical protein